MIDAGKQPRYMGTILRLMERSSATELWGKYTDRGKTRLLAGGGEKTGTTWTSLPGPSAGKELPDSHWRIITASRLGALSVRPGMHCALPRKKQGGAPCGRPLDKYMHHVWHCRSNVAALRVHGAVVGALADELRLAGGFADLERVVPAFAVQKPDGSLETAILDITVWFPGWTTLFAIDVTIRFAGATRYTSARNTPGAAAARAEREKTARYGNTVVPLAFEHGGRLGALGMQGLHSLAEAALLARPDLGTARSLIMKWRRRLEAALFFAQADVLLRALHDSGECCSGAAEAVQALCVST